MSLSVALVMMVVVSVVSGQQSLAGQCLQNNNNFNDLVTQIDAVIFPITQFNATCLLANCPNLGLIPCPFYTNTKTDNYTAILLLLQQTGICFQSQQTLCGAPFRSVPLCSVGMTLAAITGNPNIGGTASIMPNSGTVTGLPQLQVDYEANTGDGVLQAMLTYNFQIQGQASMANGSVLPFTNVPGTVIVNTRMIIHVNSSLTNPVAILNTTSTATSNIGFLFSTYNETSLGDTTQEGLDNLVSKYIQASPFGDDLADFYGTIFAKLCLLSQRKCPWITNPGNK